LLCFVFFLLIFLLFFFFFFFFFFQAEDGIRDDLVTGVQTCALPISLISALAAVYLVFVLLVPREPPSAPESMPTTVDRGSRGMHGLNAWIESSGLRAKSLRERYDRLPEDAGLPARGNLLILTLPQAVPARQRETDALKDWVERGNAALVLDGSIESLAQL